MTRFVVAGFGVEGIIRRVAIHDPPEIDALYRALVQARPPGGDRFRIASDMFDITRAMVIAGIRAEKPQITESELRQELFLRYYGDEFSPEQRKKILAAIADYWRRKEAAQDA